MPTTTAIMRRRLRTELARERPSAGLAEVYRRVDRLTQAAQPAVPDHGWPTIDHRQVSVERRRQGVGSDPAATPSCRPRVRRSRRAVTIGRRTGRLRQVLWAIGWELVVPLVVAGAAIPSLWVQTAALTLVATATVILAAETVTQPPALRTSDAEITTEPKVSRRAQSSDPPDWPL